MKALDPETLLLRLNSGKGIREDELFQVLSLLKVAAEDGSELPLDELYTWILVVGRAKHKQAAKLLEKFLSSQDPETVALVLQILCEEWGKTEEHMEHLLRIALGAAWDHDGDAQRTAIRVLGEHLRDRLKGNSRALSALDKQIVKTILETFSDSSEERQTRQSSYFSLLRASGKEWESIPSEFARLDFGSGSPDIDWSVVELFQSLSSSAFSAASSGRAAAPGTK